MRGAKSLGMRGCGFLPGASWCCALGALITGCAGTHEYAVLPASFAMAAAAASAEEPLRVIIDTSNVHLPLVVAGANAEFTDVDGALGWSVDRALASVKKRLTAPSARPLELEAHAEESAGRLGVSLVARATLRQKSGNAYLAQTHAHARCSGAPAPNGGSDVVVQCTTAVARQLQSWLAGVIPE